MFGGQPKLPPVDLPVGDWLANYKPHSPHVKQPKAGSVIRPLPLLLLLYARARWAG